MFIQNLIENTQKRLAKRRQFNRMVAEIEGLSARDLADLHADRGELLRHARQHVYG